jgi:hypothetical protein
MTTSPFRIAFVAALDDGSLFVAGVALDLEDRDVPHTIIWERHVGVWKRYQWKNRSYALTVYPQAGVGTAIYMGYEGTLKVRNDVLGSSEEKVESGLDGPSPLRTLSSVRVVGDHLVVSGMRRMVYRRHLNASVWSRIDDGMRLLRADLTLAALYSIDGRDADNLLAVGIGGEVWRFGAKVWQTVDSPTNFTLLAIRHISGDRYLVGGELGALWIVDGDKWIEVKHTYGTETFSCIERWDERCFVGTESGSVFELIFGDDPHLKPWVVEGIPKVSWIFATPQRAWFAGGVSIVSLGTDGWRDESPPTSLVS